MNRFVEELELRAREAVERELESVGAQVSRRTVDDLVDYKLAEWARELVVRLEGASTRGRCD